MDIKLESSYLENLFGAETFQKNDSEKIKKVIELYPFKITSYLENQINKSQYIKKQFIPSVEELLTYGTETPFESGKHCSEIYGLERVYKDRVLLIPEFNCPAYCRFCFRKTRVHRTKRPMDEKDINKAIEYIGANKEIRGVLITGGDPFLDINKLDYLLSKVFSIDHIYDIRIGTRSILYNPFIITDELIKILSKYNQPDFDNPTHSKSLAINVHFNHPDELTPEVIKACHKFISNGILLRNQTVLLKNINDDPETITYLFSLLIRNRIFPYYLNHCFPVIGADHFRTSVAKGIKIIENLFKLSSTLCPHYVFASEAGKVHVIDENSLEYEKINGIKMIKKKMIYHAEEFKKYTKLNDLPGKHYIDNDGLIVAYYIDGNDE